MRRWLWCVAACLTVGCNSTPEGTLPEPEPTPAPVQTVTPTAELERLAKVDPIAFLERCRDKTEREIKSTRGTLLMRERVMGKVTPPERVQFSFKDRPYSIRMEWKEGAKLARKTLFVIGQNDGYMFVQPSGWRSLAGIVRSKPDSEDALNSSRVPITKFGMQKGIESTIRAWKEARASGDFQVTFSGRKTIPPLGDRPVWELKRIASKPCEAEGIVKATYYIDTQTCLQVGFHLLGQGDELIGTYYFRDLEINPVFDKDTFSRDGLKK